MQVKTFLIQQLGALLSDSETFGHIKNIVRHVEQTLVDPAIDGTTKRAQVRTELKALGIELAGWVGNVLLELAVAAIKIELG